MTINLFETFSQSWFLISIIHVQSFMHRLLRSNREVRKAMSKTANIMKLKKIEIQQNEVLTNKQYYFLIIIFCFCFQNIK